IIDVAAYREDETLLHACIESLIIRPFDLSADHMLRAHLIVLGPREHILVITLHHIASDAWSAGIIVKELAGFYNAYIEGVPAQLPLPAIQYADYAIWQRAYLSGALMEQKLAYWKDKLAGVSVLNFPTDYPRPAVQSTRGEMREFKFDQELSAQLKALSLEHGVTLYMALLALFKVLLYRYSGQKDICVGSPVAGRTQEETEASIGFFVNTLALRSDLSGCPSFISLLEQVKQTTLAAYDHQEVPFEKVVEAVTKERNMSRHPLFQIMFELHNMPEASGLHLEALQLSEEPIEHVASQFDLIISLREDMEGLGGRIAYCADLYNAATIDRMILHFETLLRSVVKSPDEQIGALNMLTTAEMHQLSVTFNGAVAGYPVDKTIIDLFEEQAVRTPDARAVVFEDIVLTYRELDARANQLAHYLAGKGVNAETCVPVCMERSLEMIIGILGVMKAGGAYVPIDPTYPANRINFMITDIGAGLVVSSSGWNYPADENSAIEIIDIINDWPTIAQLSTEKVRTKVLPSSLAYVIYTSGSTGQPKGVMVEHKSLVSSTLSRINYYKDIGTIFLVPSFSFDSSVAVIFWSLCAGGRLLLCKEEQLKTPVSIKGLLNNADVILCVPAYYRFLLDEDIVKGSSLKRVILAGERLDEDLVKRHFAITENSSLYNEYGPTECTVWSTVAAIEPQNNLITIGKPINNIRTYILDEEGNIVPIGVAGELHIGGTQVARGYFNRPELTTARFIPDAFGKEEGARLYKTGDVARWLPGGNIEYLGRIDEQVKIRGYRIELGEIENVLQHCGLVDQVVVLARTVNDDNSSSKQLVGYIVPHGDFDKEGILSYLKMKLPEYMIPHLFVKMEKLPLTANGKIDKQVLPAPGADDLSMHEYVAPRNETEQLLVNIWRKLLYAERVGIHDNFFELGGHSLLAIRMISEIHKALQIEIPVGTFFQLPSIAALAKYLKVIQHDFLSEEEEVNSIEL
ncbi:amino acid adenylation domain-containing protein, partial [Chitinophaga niastensis]